MAKYVEKPEAKQAGVTIPAVAQAPPPAAEPPAKQGLIHEAYETVRTAAQALSDVIQEGSAVVGSALFRARAAVDDITHTSKLEQVLARVRTETAKGIDMPDAIVSSALAVDPDHARAARLIDDAAVATGYLKPVGHNLDNNKSEVQELLKSMKKYNENDYEFLELAKSFLKYNKAEDRAGLLFDLVSSDIDIVQLVPLFEMGAYNEKYLTELRNRIPWLFTSVCATSEQVFAKARSQHPEWFPPELIRDLVSINPRLLPFLPDDYWTHDILESAVRKDPLILEFINMHYFGDMEPYYRIAVETDGHAIRVIPRQSMQSELMQIALRKYPDAWIFSEEVAVNPAKYQDKLVEAVRRDPELYPIVDVYAKNAKLNLDLAPLRFRDEVAFRRMLQAKAAMEEAIAADPLNPRHPPQRLRLFIYPMSDYNGAFADNDLLNKAVSEGDAVVCYSVSTQFEALAIIRKYLPLLRKGDHIILGGHGSKRSLSLSGGDPRDRIELEDQFDFQRLDLSDEKTIAKSLAGMKMPPGVHLYLSSCANGEGGPEDANNMMNMWYRLTQGEWHIHALSNPNKSVIRGNRLYPTYFGATYHLLPHERGYLMCLRSEVCLPHAASKGLHGEHVLYPTITDEEIDEF